MSLDIADHAESGPIRFRMSAGKWPRPAEFEVRFGKDRVDYVPTAVGNPMVLIGKRTRPFFEYWQEESPVVRFHDGSFLICND